MALSTVIIIVVVIIGVETALLQFLGFWDLSAAPLALGFGANSRHRGAAGRLMGCDLDGGRIRRNGGRIEGCKESDQNDDETNELLEHG